MRYDIPNGTLTAFDFVAGDGSGSTTLTMQDDFTLFGLPAGAPVFLTARMNVNIMKDGLGYPRGYATLSDAFGHSVYATQPGDTEITLEVQCRAGEPFRLRYKLNTISDYRSGGGATGMISFSDIPSGAVLRSCNGYVSAGVVPVRTSSWAKLKSFYR